MIFEEDLDHVDRTHGNDERAEEHHDGANERMPPDEEHPREGLTTRSRRPRSLGATVETKGDNDEGEHGKTERIEEERPGEAKSSNGEAAQNRPENPGEGLETLDPSHRSRKFVIGDD